MRSHNSGNIHGENLHIWAVERKKTKINFYKKTPPQLLEHIGLQNMKVGVKTNLGDLPLFVWCLLTLSLKRFKKLNLLCNLSSSCLIVGDTITGRVTTNPIVLGIIPGSDLISKTYCETKDLKRKIELCRFAFTTYEDIPWIKLLFKKSVIWCRELFGPTENCR